MGNLVTANCRINTTGAIDLTGGSGNLKVDGLPFNSPAASDLISANVGYAYQFSVNPAGGFIAGSSDHIALSRRYTSITGNLSLGDVSDLDTSGGTKNDIMISVTYQTT